MSHSCFLNVLKLFNYQSTLSIVSTLSEKAEDYKVKILTHCNTGSLATGGFGTALGVIRALRDLGRLDMAFCTETRPYNQGSRLTAYELVYEKIPAKLICDSAVSALMGQHVSLFFEYESVKKCLKSRRLFGALE